jgi:RNA polymerase sigma-70 factor (ECF subfamily)
MAITAHRREPDPLASQLGARFAAPLLKFFLRRLKDRALAEDLTQEVLLRIIRSPDAALINNPDGYVFRSAANLLRDRRRQILRNPTLRAQPLEDALSGDPGTPLVEDRSPERVLIGETTLKEVLGALDELGELTRSIFVLFRLENMQHKEIAALYGIGQSTVEKHVMKAMRHLSTRCSRE